MKKVILLLAIGVVLCWADIKVEIKEKPVPIKKQKTIKERIEQKFVDEIGTETIIQQKLKEGTETETTIRKKKEKIVREEVDTEVAMLSEKMKPLEIQIVDIPHIAFLIKSAKITDIPKLAVLISKIDTLDVSGLARYMEKVYGFILDEAEFFEAWKKKDVKELARILQNIKTSQVEFFTAWGNYQNYDKINCSRQEPFNYRQVLVSNIPFDWRDKFKPTSPIILTVDYGLDTPTIRSLLELIKENKDKIKMIILPWGQAEVNNFDNKDVSTYPVIAEWCDRLFYSIKEIYPEVPIYLTVCFTPTMDVWLKSFKAPYDGLALWNIIYITQGNHKKVYDILSKYNKNIILSGVFQCDPDKSWKSWEEVKQSFTQKDLDNLKRIGYKGVIFMTNNKDTQ